jgi:hypothetical protein
MLSKRSLGSLLIMSLFPVAVAASLQADLCIAFSGVEATNSLSEDDT